MGKPASDLTAAIKKLRSALADSQQVFANRLGLSQRAIANYEAGRRPATEVLILFRNLAADQVPGELREVFSRALSQDMKGRTTPATKEEAVWSKAALWLARNNEFVPEWRQIAQTLVSSLDGLLATAWTNSEVRTDPHELQKVLLSARQQLGDTAEHRLKQLARDHSRTTGQSFERAFAKVLLDNPELYARYNEERALAARGTNSEGSPAVARSRQHDTRQSKVRRGKNS